MKGVQISLARGWGGATAQGEKGGKTIVNFSWLPLFRKKMKHAYVASKIIMNFCLSLFIARNCCSDEQGAPWTSQYN